MPKGFRRAPQERERIEQTMDSLFPIHPLKPGVLFDLYVSNPDVQTWMLEEVSVRTLSAVVWAARCLIMVVEMLVSFNMYSGRARHHRTAA